MSLLLLFQQNLATEPGVPHGIIVGRRRGKFRRYEAQPPQLVEEPVEIEAPKQADRLQTALLKSDIETVGKMQGALQAALARRDVGIQQLLSRMKQRDEEDEDEEEALLFLLF